MIEGFESSGRLVEKMLRVIVVNYLTCVWLTEQNKRLEVDPMSVITLLHLLPFVTTSQSTPSLSRRRVNRSDAVLVEAFRFV